MKQIARIVFFIFLLVGGTIYAQDYPKYRTKKAEGTVVAEPKEERKKSEAEPANTNDADFAALMEKGMGLGREKKYAEAAEIYTQAIPLSNEENAYWPYFQRGLSYYVNHEPEKALADYNAALTKKMPSENIRGNIHMFRAFVNNELGNQREACADYKIARLTGVMQGDNIPGFECPQEEVTISVKPDDDAFERFINEANNFVKEKKFTEALQMYDKALSVCNTTNVYRVLTAKGGLYYTIKEYDKAIEEYTKALTVKLPDDKVKGHIYSMRSFVHKSNGDMGFYCADYHFARDLGVINDDDTRKDDCE